MLNDQHRNEAYREAIIKKVRQGYDRVLDVGTGTGILSLFGLEGQAKEIYACDASHTMIEIAEQIIQGNNAGGIRLMNKHSTTLLIPQDISVRVSLLVTEIFDAGLLGEDVLPTLAHAWQNLLLPPPAGLVIPFGAAVYVTGIEFDGASNDIHLKTGGFYEYIKWNVLRNCENYDTRDLKRTSFKYLTSVEKVIKIDFNNPKLINEVLEGMLDRELAIGCIRSGRLDCFAVWFDLALDEDIVINTGPESKTNAAWDQAIFFLPRSRIVRAGQRINIKVSVKDGKINLKLIEETGDGFEASEDVIKLLTDEKLVNELHELASKPSAIHSVHILDCFPFPVFGLSFLLRRPRTLKDGLTCFAQSEKDRDLITLMAEKYEIEVDCKVATDLECLEGKKFDIVLFDFVEMTGEIKDGIIWQLDYLKSLLKPSGFIIPEIVTVMGELIHSDWMLKASRIISNDVTCGYKIGEFINAYQVQHFIDLDSRAKETLCSEPFKLFSLLDNTEAVTRMTVPCLCPNSSPNAVVYWFRIKFMRDCDELTTNHEGSRCRQAAFLSRDNRVLKELQFNVIRNDGLFSVEFLLNEVQ